MQFRNRIEAGQKLAVLLKNNINSEVVVYALPRGGVILGAEIAKSLNAPLDLIITRKIGHPRQKEYAIGAVAENGHSIFDKESASDVSEDYLIAEADKQKAEARRRREVYLGNRKPISAKGKTAIIADDGIATGLTMKAAIKELKLHFEPEKIIVAIPVIPKEFALELEQNEGVEVAALFADKSFLGSVGSYYKEFPAVEDEEVIKIMKEAEK